MRPHPALLLRHSTFPHPKMASPTLPQIQETTHLSPSLIRILAGNPNKFTLQGTNTYLLGSGPERTLIDTGEGKPSWISSLKTLLRSENATLKQALITHWHGDHTGGIPSLLNAFPNTPIYKNSAQNHPSYDSSQYKFLPITDGQIFRVDEGITLRAVHTPGHTTDHICFLWEEQDALFTGDNVLGHGTAVFEDLSSYLTSLNKMKGLFGGMAYPGHGLEVRDGKSKIEEYLRHRQLREDQVVQRLMRGSQNQQEVNVKGGEKSWTLMELVRSIYQDVADTLHPAAAGGLLQILMKLEREGRVVVVQGEEEERWRLVNEGSGRGGSAL